METKGSYCVHWSINQINLVHIAAPDILAIKALSTSYIFTHFYEVYGTQVHKKQCSQHGERIIIQMVTP